jgi:hypothetical protein
LSTLIDLAAERDEIDQNVAEHAQDDNLWEKCLMLVYSFVNGFNFALSAPLADPTSGDLVNSNVNAADAKQLWQIVASIEDLDDPDGAYILINVATGLAAKPPADGNTKGVTQEQASSDPTKSAPLEWTFARQGANQNAFAVRPGSNSGQNLDAWQIPSAGSGVGIHTWENNNQQKWRINSLYYNP